MSTSRPLSGSTCVVAMSWRSELKGSVATRRSAWGWTPYLRATDSMAVSVGSPTPSPVPVSLESLQFAPTRRHHRRASSDPTCDGGTTPTSGTGTSPPPVHRTRTVIRFWVRVPVLSEQTTVAPPRVSTAGSRRITAPRRAIRETPIARVMVTAAGRPSGMAPTARATAAVNISAAASPRATPMANVTTARPRMTAVSQPLNVASLRVRGVARSLALPTSRWISPISVAPPVATTIPAPVPAVTRVPE